MPAKRTSARRPRAREPRRTDPTLGPLVEGAFPEIGAILRARVKPILREWGKLVRRHVPPASSLDFDEVLDGLPQILPAMADALASDDPDNVRRLMERSPEQGVHRFQLRYDVRELTTEDRILRRVIIDHVESGLGRRTTRAEDTALNWA